MSNSPATTVAVIAPAADVPRWSLDRLLKHRVVQNAAALYAAQIAAYLAPLATVPYVSRCLGAAKWGEVLLAQSIAVWVALVVEYGFNLSATRDIARMRDDAIASRRLAASVYRARLGLTLLSLAVPVIAFCLFPLFRAQPAMLTVAWILGATLGLNPIWYFQAHERIRRPAMLDIAAKIVSSILIFALVTSPSHGLMILIAQAVPNLAVVLLLHRDMLREIGPQAAGPRDVLAALRGGGSLFIYRLFTSLYAGMGALWLGALASSRQVAFYGAADKFKAALTGLFWPFWRSIFPRICHLAVHNAERARFIRRIATALMMGAVMAGVAVLWLAAGWLIPMILGHEYESATPVFRVLILCLLPVAAGGMLGIQSLLPSGRDARFLFVTISVGLLFLASAPFIASHRGALGLAWLTFAAESLVAVGFLIAHARLPKTNKRDSK